MTRDNDRIGRVTELMKAQGLDALVCHRSHSVLMLSGYLPVLGQSIVVLLPDGDGVLIAPEAESFFAKDGWFTDIRTFNPITLDYILSPLDVAAPLLAEVCYEKGIADGVLGIEARDTTTPASYLESYSLGCMPRDRWTTLLPAADLRDADDLLEGASVIKTSREIEHIRIASMLAQYGFEAAKHALRVGAREVEVAAAAKSAVETEGTGRANVRRVDAWAFCMSGPRSADAYLPYQYSTNRHLEAGDAAVVHINCHADGYWTDLTRTFFVGDPSPEQEDAYNAVLEAWDRSFDTVGQGVKAVDVDAAARSVLRQHDYGDPFVHGTGHGVGFKAIYHGERPVIHPQSEDVLENDMVFNLEPAVYLRERWGIRVCDVVSVRGDEAKVLSDMRRDIDWATCPID